MTTYRTPDGKPPLYFGRNGAIHPTTFELAARAFTIHARDRHLDYQSADEQAAFDECHRNFYGWGED